SVWPLVATLHMADQGVPVAFITTADGGTGLVSPSNDWDDTPGVQYSDAVTKLGNSGVNSIAAILWWQGESDTVFQVSRSAYNAALDDLITRARAEGGALANATLICAQIGERS